MDDLEKIAKGLECCAESTNDDPFQRCDECPYNDISISVQDCRAVLSRDALDLIRGETEPVWHPDIRMWECGACCGPIRGSDKHCPECGRRIKWGA